MYLWLREEELARKARLRVQSMGDSTGQQQELEGPHGK